jgi:aryl-alcohol dehydrogenase-like predicted oxidoreductase
MKQAQLADLPAGRLGLGAMGMSVAYAGAGSDDAESIRTIHRAIDLGVTLIDTAEVYGPYINEELVARALQGRRDQVVLATKFGLISHTGRDGLDSSPANIRIAVDGSLQRRPTALTSTTNTASTVRPRLKTRLERWPSWLLPERSDTSVFPKSA